MYVVPMHVYEVWNYVCRRRSTAAAFDSNQCDNQLGQKLLRSLGESSCSPQEMPDQTYAHLQIKPSDLRLKNEIGRGSYGTVYEGR
jgi:hypothetical protein